jgi:uncharacterized damage-inducible protein DinB
MAGWTSYILKHDELDFSTMDYKPTTVTSNQELLEKFEGFIKEAVEALKSTEPAEFMKPWTLRNGEQVFFTMPKAQVLRSMVLNHIIHHRAQLSVYFRLLGVPVPGAYGPSADEMPG